MKRPLLLPAHPAKPPRFVNQPVMILSLCVLLSLITFIFDRPPSEVQGQDHVPPLAPEPIGSSPGQGGIVGK